MVSGHAYVDILYSILREYATGMARDHLCSVDIIYSILREYATTCGENLFIFTLAFRAFYKHYRKLTIKIKHH